jgi:hypothetical protein
LLERVDARTFEMLSGLPGSGFVPARSTSSSLQQL